jgi:hypothetical protein
MADYQSFKHGAAEFPLALTASTTQSLLRDADPFVFYALEFFARVLNVHIGDRLEEEASNVGMERITSAVAETLPYHPGEYLTRSHVKFPLLAIDRKEGKFDFQGQRKRTVDTFDVFYVLPPLNSGEYECLKPILKAVVSVIDNRTELGFDPSYTPTTPAGTAGERVWSEDRAGVDRVDVTGADWKGGFAVGDLFFPCVVISIAAVQGYDVVTTELEEFDGANVSLDHYDPATESTDTDFIALKTYPEIDITAISPDTGPKAGGTAVTITYSGDLGTDLPSIKIGGVAVSNIVVVNTTTITAVTGAHSSPVASLVADVDITNSYGDTATLSAAFTYTA